MTHELTAEQRQFLLDNKMRGNRWVYNDDHKSIIAELIEAGVMQPMHGVFIMGAVKEEDVRLFGVNLPVIGKMISLYKLTLAGELKFPEILEAEATP